MGNVCTVCYDLCCEDVDLSSTTGGDSRRTSAITDGPTTQTLLSDYDELAIEEVGVSPPQGQVKVLPFEQPKIRHDPLAGILHLHEPKNSPRIIPGRPGSGTPTHFQKRRKLSAIEAPLRLEIPMERRRRAASLMLELPATYAFITPLRETRV